MTAEKIERTIVDRKAELCSLDREIQAAEGALPGLMDNATAYEREFEALAVKKRRRDTIAASIGRLEAQLLKSREDEAAAKGRADLADFNRRKTKAAPGRRRRYEKLAADLADLAREMVAERAEAEALRHRGLGAQPDISHNVIGTLHLPKWSDGEGVIYRPAGTDGFALHAAFRGRRA